jgi:hypothetical protein
MEKDLSKMSRAEVLEFLIECFPWLSNPEKPRYPFKTKEQREREIQFGAGDEHQQWWIEQNRLDSLRRWE